MKIFVDKASFPGEKQVYRVYQNGMAKFDLIALAKEVINKGDEVQMRDMNNFDQKYHFLLENFEPLVTLLYSEGK